MSMLALEGRLDRAELDLALLATAAMPPVRQPPSATRTISTGVAPLSSEANCSGWSVSKVNVSVCSCSSPRP